MGTGTKIFILNVYIFSVPVHVFTGRGYTCRYPLFFLGGFFFILVNYLENVNKKEFLNELNVKWIQQTKLVFSV